MIKKPITMNYLGVPPIYRRPHGTVPNNSNDPLAIPVSREEPISVALIHMYLRYTQYGGFRKPGDPQ